MKARHLPVPSRSARGFSLIELLITLAVIASLSAILLPAFARVHDMARRLMCQNHMRSMFIALEAFSANQGQASRAMYPGSIYTPTTNGRDGSGELGRPQQLMALTADRSVQRSNGPRLDWDGLGRLWTGGGSFIGDQGTFYCPAHHSIHSVDRYADSFASRSSAPAAGPVYSNYHYWAAWNAAARARASSRPIGGPSNVLGLDRVLLTDGLRTRQDVNHGAGCNVLKDDGEITWLSSNDYFKAIAKLPTSETERSPAEQAKIFQDLLRELKSVR